MPSGGSVLRLAVSILDILVLTACLRTISIEIVGTVTRRKMAIVVWTTPIGITPRWSVVIRPVVSTTMTVMVIRFLWTTMILLIMRIMIPVEVLAMTASAAASVSRGRMTRSAEAATPVSHCSSQAFERGGFWVET